MKHIIPAKPAYCAIAAAIAALTLLPAYVQASTAKEYAMDYCKRQEATKLDYDPKSDGTHQTDRWYGQERNRFYTWEECVKTKTQEFAVEKEPAKAEFAPTDKDRAYAKSYCSRRYKNPGTGTIWYGGAAEAEQPNRTITNSNFYLSQEACETAKTAESFYGATVVGDAPYTKQSNEDIARMYCTGHTAVRHNREVTVYGVGNVSYDSQDACVTDQLKYLDQQSAYIEKVKAEGIMQPYDLTATAGTQVAVNTDGTATGNDLGALPGLINTKAINQDECAIWLCLPAGFPPGCESAHKAMLKRLKKGRSALPDFASCAVDDEKQPEHGFASNEETVIKVNGSYRPGNTCLSSRSGGKDGDKLYIPGCTGVYRKVTVTQHGNPVGQTHYELIRANKPWEGAPANP